LDGVAKVLERLLAGWTFKLYLAPVNQASETKDMAAVWCRFVNMRTQTNSTSAVIVGLARALEFSVIRHFPI
jgi:hypothetical protein